MTLHQPIIGNASATHFEPERFQVFAASELAGVAPWKPGICFNPSCTSPFVLVREWQIYCCDACARVGRQEMRTFGSKMALSALTWRQFKYAVQDTPEADLARAARRHFTQIQSYWLADRAHRMEGVR